MSWNETITRNQKAFDANRNREKHSVEWLKKIQEKVRKPIALTTLAGTVNGILVIAQAFVLSFLLHQMIMERHGWIELKHVLSGLLVIFILRGGCTYFFQTWGFSAAATVKKAVRRQLMDKIAMAGPMFLKQKHSAQLASVVMEQVSAMENYFCRYLPQKNIAVLTPLLIIGVVFPVNWVVGIIFLVTGPLVPVFMALIGMGAAAASRNQFLEMERMGSYFLDRLQGITTLKLFGHAERELGHIQRVSDRFREKTMEVLRIAFLSSAVLEFFSAVAVALVAVYVGLGLLGLVRFGPATAINLQEALFVLILAPEFFIPLRQLAVNYHDRAAAVAAADNILSVLEYPDQTLAPKRSCDSDYCLELNNVSVDFQQRQVLKQVNLRVRRGEELVLTGETGAGKTTLFNVLLGFVQPSSGSVRIKGQSVDKENVFREIVWVSQNCAIFYGSIADNISLFDDEITHDDILQAAQAAGVTEFSHGLAEGLQTMIGEQGYGLSGGQIQRIALARAFLNQADIILLDEPTAYLDEVSKKQLMDTFDDMFAGKTVIIATHDPGIIRRKNRKIHLQQGTLV